MTKFELPAETKAATGFTHKVIVTFNDLTLTTADADQTLELLSVPAGTLVEKAAIKLVTPFEDLSDTAFNDTQVQLGDGGDTDRFVTATQVNDNGTEVYYKSHANTTAYAYTSADTIDLLVESMAAKALNDFDAGELHVYLSVVELTDY